MLKYLGVEIDTNFSWQYPVNDVSINPLTVHIVFLSVPPGMTLKVTQCTMKLSANSPKKR